jgi:hypothetical protein
MGRYYSGDIEGKFWVAVQDSADADFFGVVGTQPDLLQYYFDEDDLDKIKEGVKSCLTVLGDWKKKLDDFFETKGGYNEKMLEDEIGPEGYVNGRVVCTIRFR